METNKQTGAVRFHTDVPKAVRNHLLGKDHSPKHRFIFGTAIMLFGISIVKGSLFLDSFVLHFLADVVGYLLHGVGALPIFKAIEQGGRL